MTDDRDRDRGDDPDAWLGLSGRHDGDGPPGGGWFRDCRNAAIVLTGWPLGRRGEIGRAAAADSRRAFVPVGLALGLPAALIAWIADGLGLQIFGAAVFAAAALVILTNARAESGAAAAAADLAGTEAGSDRRFALIAGCVGAILLARVAGLSAMASLADMLGALIAAQVLSAAIMALATLPATPGAVKPDDTDPLFGPQRDGERNGGGSVALWTGAAAALLLAILFLGLWSGLLAYAVAMLVAGLVWGAAEICRMPRDRNFLYTIRIKTELAVIVTAAAAL
ncbi:MAG: hypothetical protein F4204_06845 [Rhodospirillaceae bacterium]|nr:hypothetical protein [Rhodospirillaceae bacterium]MXW92294.1 hypothetical protein [Rhodospirillaceae bacterium]MYB12924.1 hypothetical protein [Rhodospirillaceae bacterium]MYG52064.1 hypothetical protein [Rhodospirillaceae bacterium]MYI49092.1 hypothetical protein [Rhodospirillaceae bacterium]